MRVFAFLQLLLAIAVPLVADTDNGYTDVVSWDEHSIFINGDRIFIFAGEFHYPRLPVPELWFDVLQKFKASGLNTVSLYFFWNYHSPSPDVFDFTSPGKDVQLLLDLTKEAGLYVIARVGPYVNGEYNAGGVALWGTDGSAGDLRTSNETYHQAWLPWIQAIGGIIADNQITSGGPVILVQVENELQETVHEANNTLVLYMEQLEEALRDAGIVVPFTSNEKGMRSQSWSTDYEDVGGAVDVYGLDSYPGGLSCTNIDSGFNVVRTYYQWFQNYSYTQPEFLPEFEGGYFQPWGGYFYDQCLAEHDSAFPDVYYKELIAQRATLISLYVAFGGTNWGHSAAPVVYSSYDYSAPLRETREIQDKFKHTKLVSLFTRASQDLWKTDMESNGTGNAVDNTAIWTWVLRNPDTSAGFYFTEHMTSKSRDNTNFSLTVNTTEGSITIPTLDLQGRQTRITVTDYSFGNDTLLYSSAQVLSYGLFDVPVLVFYLNVGQIGEFAFKSGSKYQNFTTYGASTNFAAKATSNGTSTAFQYTQGEEATIVKFSSGLIAYLLNTKTAYNFFAPPTTSSPAVAPDQQIFILGPYLVRNASTANGVVAIHGDNTNQTTIEVYTGDASISTVNWNGADLSTTRTSYGSLQANLSGIADLGVSLPALENWKVADSLPEANRHYDDSHWLTANKTSTTNPVAPLTLPVLYGSDYGYYTGALVYRGYFDSPAARSASSANITVQGGVAAGWNAWLNGALVGGSQGNASLSATSAVLEFGNATLHATDNVLTVVADYSGHDETSTGPYGPENPRGVLGATLFGGNGTLSFARWKIRGNAGGGAGYIDAVRGPLNEGGLYGERLGWHLPGFDSSNWTSGAPTEGFVGGGIKWYNTEFELDVPEGVDAPIGVELGAPEGTVARVQIYVNGYQYGKYWPHIGPQTRFPVPPGILNNNGANHLSLSLWAQTDAGAQLSNVSLILYGKYASDFGFSRDWSALQPGWTAERLQYA